MIFTQHYLGCLSQASYLIGDETTGRAVVVDPLPRRPPRAVHGPSRSREDQPVATSGRGPEMVVAATAVSAADLLL